MNKNIHNYKGGIIMATNKSRTRNKKKGKNVYLDVSDKTNPIVEGIIEDLSIGTLSKKEIANKYRLDIAIVFKISNCYAAEIIQNSKQIIKAEAAIEENNIIVEKEVKEEKTEEETITKENKKSIQGKRDKLDDSTILKIVDMCEANIPKLAIAEQLGISVSSVYKYAEEFNLTNPKTIKTKAKKNTSSKKVEKVQEKEVTTPKVKVFSKKETMVVGLVKDRHEMPVNEYIFNRIDDDIMFDYHRLDAIVSNFIKNKLRDSKDLIVYVTGLTCCTASVIKMCYHHKINLTLMHHNISNGKYFPQIIWDEFSDNIISKIFPEAKEVYLHECEPENILENEFYSIKVIKFVSCDTKEITNDIFLDQKKVWIRYGELLSEIMVDKSTKAAIYLDKCKIENNYIKFIDKMNAMYNFERGE